MREPEADEDRPAHVAVELPARDQGDDAERRERVGHDPVHQPEPHAAAPRRAGAALTAARARARSRRRGARAPGLGRSAVVDRVDQRQEAQDRVGAECCARRARARRASVATTTASPRLMWATARDADLADAPLEVGANASLVARRGAPCRRRSARPAASRARARAAPAGRASCSSSSRCRADRRLRASAAGRRSRRRPRARRRPRQPSRSPPCVLDRQPHRDRPRGR